MPQIHVSGPEAGDIVIVTSEAVVAAILDRRISASQAIEKGVLVIDRFPREAGVPPSGVRQRAGNA